MRTRSKRARHCPICHGRNRSGTQRWMCPCSITSTARRQDRARAAQ
ncbi:IS256 family transposase, partial [Bifidobacterium sp. H6bp22N]|nr:IS256 family transposase [Bifidobacterium sp. H6bp22N]